MENSAVIQAGDIVVLPSCSAPGITIPVEESMEVMLVSRDELLARAFSDGSVYNLRLMDRNVYPIPIQRFNTWGYADENDMIIIPFDFDFAEPFYGDRAKVSITDTREAFYINKKGEWIDDTFELKEGYTPIYVLQLERQLDTDSHETILGVFCDYETAAFHLRQHRDMFIEYSSINDEDTPAYFDQDNCYWDSFHYLTIREKAVPAVDRGSHIYGVRKTIKSNVIEVTEATAFFSNRKDMLDSLSAKIESSHPTGLADLKTREAMTQSEVFSVEVFILQ